MRASHRTKGKNVKMSVLYGDVHPCSWHCSQWPNGNNPRAHQQLNEQAKWGICTDIVNTYKAAFKEENFDTNYNMDEP